MQKWYIEITWQDGEQTCRVLWGDLLEVAEHLKEQHVAVQNRAPGLKRARSVRAMPFEQSPFKDVEALKAL